MGHWWERPEFIDQVARRVGGQPDRDELRAVAARAAAQVEMLAGRSFGQAKERTENIDSGGFPFAHVDDVQVGSHSADRTVWFVPDPAEPALSSVLQVTGITPAATAISDGQALRVAGLFASETHRRGRLSSEFVLELLRPLFDASVSEEERRAFFRRLMDPAARIHAPIACTRADGWWMQITRRLLMVTNRTPDSPHLVEPVLAADLPLVAVEPVLILARMTTHPVERAFVFRIWPRPVRGTSPALWRFGAEATHRHGIPILTLDDASSPEEVSCQLVLVSHWHGYLSREDAVVGDVITAAYPEPIERIRRATGSPDAQSAAALLLRGLLRPGFDPTRGAHATRRYVASKARIAVLEHRKETRQGAHPWERLGVSERFYYKLLPRFTRRAGRHWIVDDATLDAIAQYLRESDKERELRRDAMTVLKQRGFTHAAARKWLQRHPVQGIPTARPRPRRVRRRA